MDGFPCQKYADNGQPEHLIQLANASVAAHDAVLAGRDFSVWPRNPACRE